MWGMGFGEDFLPGGLQLTNCRRNDLISESLRLNLFTKSALRLKNERQNNFVLFS